MDEAQMCRPVNELNQTNFSARRVHKEKKIDCSGIPCPDIRHGDVARQRVVRKGQWAKLVLVSHEQFGELLKINGGSNWLTGRREREDGIFEIPKGLKDIIRAKGRLAIRSSETGRTFTAKVVGRRIKPTEGVHREGW
jgi:hypothetical protein